MILEDIEVMGMTLQGITERNKNISPVVYQANGWHLSVKKTYMKGTELHWFCVLKQTLAKIFKRILNPIVKRSFGKTLGL